MRHELAATGQSAWRAKLGELFGIDPRSLALFRIFAGILILVDLAFSASDLRSMYADDGMFSIAASKDHQPSPWYWSLHCLNGSVEYQAILFTIAAVFAFALLAGYYTRLATIVSFVMLASLQVRVPLLYNGGDMLLRVMLFWAMFVPLGQCWSIDALRRPRGGERAIKPVVSVGTTALLLQLCLMYWFTGLLKLNDDWLKGDGLYYALSLDYFGRPLGQYLLSFPALLKWLTIGTLCLELVGPALIWFPFGTRYLRLAVIVAFAALHVGIELCLTVGLFSYISLAAWTVFLPSCVWDSRFWQRIEAGIESRLGRLWPVRPAAERPATAFGLRAALVGRLANGTVCSFLLVYVLAWNVATLYGSRASTVMPPSMSWIGRVTMLQQHWSMYVVPPRFNGWFVAQARLRDGSIVDVLRNGAPVDYEKPKWIAATFPNQHWRYLFRYLTDPGNERFRQGVADYLYRDWNQRHGPDQQIVSLDLIYFGEWTDRERAPGNFARYVFGRVEAEPREVSNNFSEALDALKRGESIWP
jgi:hypothetical protein